MSKYAHQMFVGAIFVYTLALTSLQINDPDFWWHLKTGEYIVKNCVIPHSDFFSFTNVGKEWVAHEWLSEALFFIIYSALGFRGLIIVFALIATAALWIAFKRFDGHPLIGGFAVLLGGWCALPTLGVRPRVFTFLFTSIYLALLARYARRGDGRAIWWLVPLMTLWVNLHGGFLLGPVLIVLTMIGIVLDDWFSSEHARTLWLRIKTLGAVLLGCLAAALINPNGPRIYAFPFEIFFSPFQQSFVTDWFSPNFHDDTFTGLTALMLITVAVFALSPKSARPSDLLFYLATLYATLKSGRHIAIFSLVAIPLLAENLRNVFGSVPWGRPFTGNKIAIPRSGIKFYALYVLPLLLALILMLVTTLYEQPTREALEMPVKAVEFIKNNRLSGNTFNIDTWGGYIIWKLPSNPVYIDGRVDMYGDEFSMNYLNIIRGAVDWRAPFDSYGVRIALLQPKTILARELQNSPNWENVYEDNSSVVFRRR